MKYILVFVAILFASYSSVDAQIRLRTPEGKIVLLFDNGTWKYEELKKITEEQKAIENKESITSIVLKDIELDALTVIKGESAKLSKFLDAKDAIKCTFKLKSEKDKVVLKTDWKVLDEEGSHFFGYITKKSKIDLELANGEIVSLQYADYYQPKEYVNYGFSTYSAELELSKENIRKLQVAYITKATMKWSRRTETYTVFDPDYFLKELPKIIE